MNKEELQKTYQEIVLKTNGGIDDYVVALCKIGNAIGELDDQQQQISDLQHKLEVAKKALELACEELMGDLEFNGELDKHYNLQANIEYFKTKAREMMKSE